MSWQSMANELVGQAPIDIQYALTLISRAWQAVQRNYQWSFLQDIDIAIPTIGQIFAGTVTLVRGLNTVVGDATAQAAWNAIGLVTPITTLQFRIGSGTIYNIVAYNPGSGTLTLDRLYVDPPSGAAQAYAILQCYFNAPFQDFTWWDSFVDPVTGYSFDTEMTRQELDDKDPQRLQNNTPVAVVPYQINTQPGNFFGFPMYEMWPGPASGFTYVGKCFRAGAKFQNLSDNVAAQLGEDIVIEQAKQYVYEWCEANRDKMPPAQRGADFRFLIGKCQKEYIRLENGYINKDSAFSHFHHIPYASRRKNLQLPWVSQRTSLAYFPG